MDLIERIGALAGLLSFLGLAVLALLYFSQSRDVRRLREWAGRAPERAAAASETQHAAIAEQTEAMRKAEEERRKIEEKRQAEQRAVAEREARRQRRQRGEGESRWEGWRARLPELRYLVVILGGVIILGAGAAVGATQIFGGGGKDHASKRGAANKQVVPSQVEVAVLNGTAIPGLAAKVCDDIKANGFQCGAVTNSQSSFSTSVVMFERGHKREASAVGHDLGVRKLRVITPQITSVANGASVAVVVGQDRAQA
jgi:LytR cell envelope-related transcriptional attenuator